jgi:3-isopropylmalate dehydrogenase
MTEMKRVKALIAVLPGDGIGPEVVAQGTALLRALAEKFGHQLELVEAPMGGIAIDQTGSPLPDSTLELCQRADAVLLGAVGGPKWDPPARVRPEQGLLKLRQSLGLFANLRPVAPLPSLIDASTLKPEVLRGVDLMVVRELTGGIYFGEKKREADRAVDVCLYTEEEVVRVVRVAAELARGRKKRLVSVDKANVLETSQLWRAVVTEVARDYPGVRLEHMYVDACALRLVLEPRHFDVVLTDNLFGDILSDVAAAVSGSLGLLPSATLGGRVALYEPVHGSAPDLAGRDVANPLGAILCVAMLLRHTAGLAREADDVASAVRSVLADGLRTADVAGQRGRAVGTRTMGEAVEHAVVEHLEHRKAYHAV